MGNWTTVTIPSISLSAGTQVMRVYYETNSFNFNYVNLRRSLFALR